MNRTFLLRGLRALAVGAALVSAPVWANAQISGLNHTLDPHRSLIVLDEEILDNFSFEEVMKHLVETSGVDDVSALSLFQQWWATQMEDPTIRNPFETKLYCDTWKIAGEPALNGYPLECPRPEAVVASKDPFEGDGIFYFPIALVNRFDLAPSDGSHCGEYRIAFSIGGGTFEDLTAGRKIILFEPQMPNPNPENGLEGCRPVAQFWADLSNPAKDGPTRAQELR